MKEQIRSFISALEQDPGDEKAMAGIEELVTGEGADRNRDLLAGELQAGRERLVQIGHFENACKLLELEAAIASGDRAREGALLVEQARLCDEELFDQKVALDLYKKALEIDPQNEELGARVGAIEEERDKWQAIVDKFVEQAKAATEPSLKAHMLYSAAERTYKNHKRGKDIPALLGEALETDHAHLKAARLLEKVLRERERWKDLADLYVRLAGYRSAKGEQAQMLMAAVRVLDRHLEDKDAAAAHCAKVLELEPGNEMALRFLVAHYEAREDWDRVVAAYESALAGSLSSEEEVAMLMQAGMIHWRMKGDLDAAEDYFRRLRKIDPAHRGALNFYRALAKDKGDSAKLLQVLNDAQRATGDSALHDELTKEIAQLAAVDGGNVERAIDAWKAVLRKEPDHAKAKAELKRLYTEGEKWNALLDLLKGEADGLPDSKVAEKVRIYEEIVEIYRERLALGTLVINTYKTILALDPENRAAQEALTETYQKEGRWNDLITLLTQRAKVSTEPAEKIAFLLRVAALWTERFNNLNRAVAPLEEVLAIDPTNRSAIETLTGVYNKRRAWRPLLELMEKEVALLEGDAKRDRLVEMANLAAERLSDTALAIQLWRQVLDLAPDTQEALANLEKLTERSKDWAGLSDVIERRVEQSRNDEDRIAFLTKLGVVYKDRLHDPARAAGAWKRVLEIQPDHQKSMRSLKEAYSAAQDWKALEELYSAAGDFEGLVEVLGVAADRTSDAETKVMLSFRCAEIYDNPIGQPDRALRHYERVITVDPENRRAARALVDLYRRGEKWNRLLNVLKVVLDDTRDASERIALMNEMREVSETRMNNRPLAFEWAAKAFLEQPGDEAVRLTLEACAEAADKFSELVGLYRENLDKFSGPDRIAMERHVAELCVGRLRAVDDAVSLYRAILEKEPRDQGAMAALEELFRTNARWEELIKLYEHRISLTDKASDKRDLVVEMARLYEDGMDRPDLAEERYRVALDLAPRDPLALSALERLARGAEKWEALAEILEQRRGLEAAEEGEWREVTLQLGRLYNEQLDNRSEAIARYSEILDRYPGDAETIVAMEQFLRDDKVQAQVAGILEPHLVAGEDWRRLAWVLAILTENAADPASRLELQTRLAEVYGTRLGDQRVAFETLGAALKEHPADTSLWDAMTAIAEEQGILPDLADRLEGAYRSGKIGPEREVDLARRLAGLLDGQLGRPGDAVVYHRKVFEAAPQTEGTFLALEGFYTGEEKWNDLLDLYKSALEQNVGVYPPIDLQLKICFILEEVQHRVGEAIEAYRAVLDMDPGNAQAIRSLATLYEEAERWDDLSGLLGAELADASGEQKTALKYRLGDIAERHLNAPEDGLEYYEQVLAEEPDHLRAQEALERLLELPALRQRAARVLEQTYKHQGAAEPLTRVLRIQLEDPRIDVTEKIEILKRVAELRERRLSDPLSAFDALAEAFAAYPEGEDLRAELSRLATENDLNAKYAGVLDAAIPGLGDNKKLAGALLLEVARLYDEQLGDIARAEEAYRRLLDLDQGDPETAMPAVRALERLLSGGEAWEPLLDILRIKVRLAGDPREQIEILKAMAEIEESVLERAPNAVALFREILDSSDSDPGALSGLERLYERLRSWPDLIDILRRRAAVESSDGARRTLLLRVARLYESELRDVDEAIAAYTQVNAEAGLDAEALDALGRLYEGAGRWRDLLDVCESKAQLATGDEERARLFFQMGDLLRTRLDDPEQAVSRLGEALALDSGYAEARSSLEALLEAPVRREAIRILRPIYEAESDYAKLIRCDEIEVEETEDPVKRAELLRHAAEMAEVGLNQYGRAFEFMGRAFRAGTASPDLGQIVDHLERLAVEVKGQSQLVALYREIGPDILDSGLQVRCNLRVAQIAHADLGDLDLAREYYVKILDVDPENLVAMDALEAIYENREQYLELFEIYRRKAQCLSDEQKRREVLFKQARICEEKLEDVSGAATIYESILDLNGDDRDAMRALERLYPRLERWSDLMNLLERQVEIEREGRVVLLHRLGTLAEQKLGDDERALEFYRRALQIDPRNAETLASLESAMGDRARRGRVAEILAPVYKVEGDWNKLVGALEAQLESCEETLARKDLLRQIGMLQEEQLGNLETAFDTFARLFREDLEDKSSWDVLTRLASVLEAWPALAKVYAGALDDVVGDTPTTAELSFILGKIYEDRLGKPEEATKAYRRTLAFAPDDPNAFSAVERMLLATQTWSELLNLYREAADASVETARRKDFLFKIADIQKSAHKDLDAAIEALRSVLEVDALDETAIRSLDELYQSAGRFEDLAAHLRAQIDQEGDPVARNRLRCRLGKLYETSIEDLSTAVDVYEEALHEENGGPEEPLSALEHLILNEEQRQRIADILEPIYRGSDEWKKLIVILSTQVEYLEGPADKAGKWREVADLHGSRGGNYLLAFEAIAKAFKANPSDRELLSETVRLAKENANWDAFVQVLESVVEAIYDVALKSEVLHLLGSAYDHQLDTPRKAIGAYRAVLEINDADAQALDALEGLYNLVGDWEGLVEVLAMKAGLAAEARDRAELLRTKASIHEDLMSAADDAIEAYLQALDADPTSEVTMDALERLFEGAKRWNDLIEIKRKRVEVVAEEEDRLEVLRSIARVYENELKDAVEAMVAWRAVLERSGQDTAAIEALDRLYTAESMHAELLENLKLQKSLATDQAALVSIGTRVGRLQEKELADPEGAIESYREVLGVQPTHAEAIEALERIAKDESFRARAIEVLEPLHREAARWDRLAAVLELKIEILETAEARLRELRALAELHEAGRSDPGAAFSTYTRALAVDPSQTDILDALERIAGAEALWDRLAEIYRNQVEKVYDTQVEWALLTRLGDVRETHQGDIRGAIEAFRRALDGGSTDPHVLLALDRLYLGEAKWAELDEILEREIEIAASPEEINRLKLRQGEIREREFDDVPGAIAAFRDVVESAPENDVAVAALQALLERDQFVEEVVEVLTPVYERRNEPEMISELFEHRLRVTRIDAEKVQLYRELARHQEQALGDLSATFDACAKAFAIEPAEPGLLDEMERLAGELGAWTALVEAVEQVLTRKTLDPTYAVQLGLRVARWAGNNVGDPVKAEALYRSVLEREPDHQEALAALEVLLRNLGKFAELIPVMQQRAEVLSDFNEKKALYTAIATVARGELGDRARAMEAYRAVRELDSADLDAIDRLVELTRETGDQSALVELLMARAEATPEPSEANPYRHAAAEIYAEQLQSPDRAVEVYREILEHDPRDEAAASRLESLYEALERWTDLSDLIADRLNAAETDSDRIAAHKRLAQLCEQRFESADDAIGHLSEVLLIEPDEAGAVEGLDRLYQKTERWPDLVELLENRADRAKEGGDTALELRLLTRIGLIWDEKLDDASRATAIYERVLEANPEHTGALAALARLYEAAGDFERCAEVLGRAAAASRGGPDEAEVHFRLARLHQAQGHDEAEAASELRRAVECDPGHLEANRALADYCRKTGDNAGLLQALEREQLRIDVPARRVEKLLEIAALQAGPLGDKAGAVAALEQARALVPANRDVLLRLSDAYLEAGRQRDAIPVIESLIDAETDGGKKRSKNAAVFHQRLAKAYLAEGDEAKAVENLESAYKIDISNIEVLIGLGQLYYRRADYDKAVKLFRALLLQRFDPSTSVSKADIYWYVGDISLKQGDPKKAKGMFQRGLDEDRNHEKCKAGLAACS